MKHYQVVLKYLLWFLYIETYDDDAIWNIRLKILSFIANNKWHCHRVCEARIILYIVSQIVMKCCKYRYCDNSILILNSDGYTFNIMLQIMHIFKWLMFKGILLSCLPNNIDLARFCNAKMWSLNCILMHFICISSASKSASILSHDVPFLSRFFYLLQKRHPVPLQFSNGYNILSYAS